jgi:hypothetical protein
MESERDGVKENEGVVQMKRILPLSESISQGQHKCSFSQPQQQGRFPGLF